MSLFRAQGDIASRLRDAVPSAARLQIVFLSRCE
jgi:hypothetical protein